MKVPEKWKSSVEINKEKLNRDQLQQSDKRTRSTVKSYGQQDGGQLMSVSISLM